VESIGLPQTFSFQIIKPFCVMGLGGIGFVTVLLGGKNKNEMGKREYNMVHFW
jgi:hypothetical protein